MPVKIPDNLPAAQILRDENIFVMTEEKAIDQEIRPLQILILNLMPTKEVTETQLLRRIGNTPLQVDVILMRTETYTSRHTPSEHLNTFYTTFSAIRHRKFDGLVITGAPVEMMRFEDVDYWQELTEIIEWSKDHVFSTLYICWAAQAALYYHYGVPKHELQKKCFGVFKHKVLNPNSPLLRGFDEYFYAPHSRHTEVRAEDIEKVPELELLSVSDKAGVYIAASRDAKYVFVTGHSEYDPNTLKLEYERDLNKGLTNVPFPYHYFQGNDPNNPPNVRWLAHSNLLFQNWLNYFIYQETPYIIEEIGN